VLNVGDKLIVETAHPNTDHVVGDVFLVKNVGVDKGIQKAFCVKASDQNQFGVIVNGSTLVGDGSQFRVLLDVGAMRTVFNLMRRIGLMNVRHAQPQDAELEQFRDELTTLISHVPDADIEKAKIKKQNRGNA
jgi:hypothetical protein